LDTPVLPLIAISFDFRRSFCTMLEELKKEYWWEVDEEEKEYHTKLEPSISSS